MGVRRKQYAMELERELGKRKILRRANKTASMRSKTGSKADKFDRPSLTDKAILKGLRLVKGLRRKKK